MKAYPVSFEDTETAFAYKSGKELEKSRMLFASMQYRPLVKLGTLLTPLAIRWRLPIKPIIRNTLFRQFVGGETLEETANVAGRLARFGVKVILDYGVEGKSGEQDFDVSCAHFIRVIEYASSQPGIPFISVKVTGIARFGLLEKLDAAASPGSGCRGRVHTEVLDDEERKEWLRVAGRMDRICAAASARRVAVLIDAEETWIQDPVDALTTIMMEKYNQQEAIVYNTVQLYRQDRLRFLTDAYVNARERSYILAVKLVRGAYMEKERSRAQKLDYHSPIQPDKDACDKDFNEAIRFCIKHIQHAAVVVATHNEFSNRLCIGLMEEYGLPHDHPRIHFSQLYGMSDHITFNLARGGYSVSKYLPFGPIDDVIPYLMRRAEENSAVAGQTGRELRLINKELKRRKEQRIH